MFSVFVIYLGFFFFFFILYVIRTACYFAILSGSGPILTLHTCHFSIPLFSSTVGYKVGGTRDRVVRVDDFESLSFTLWIRIPNPARQFGYYFSSEETI